MRIGKRGGKTPIHSDQRVREGVLSEGTTVRSLVQPTGRRFEGVVNEREYETWSSKI